MIRKHFIGFIRIYNFSFFLLNFLASSILYFYGSFYNTQNSSDDDKKKEIKHPHLNKPKKDKTRPLELLGYLPLSFCFLYLINLNQSLYWVKANQQTPSFSIRSILFLSLWFFSFVYFLILSVWILKDTFPVDPSPSEMKFGTIFSSLVIINLILFLMPWFDISPIFSYFYDLRSTKNGNNLKNKIILNLCGKIETKKDKKEFLEQWNTTFTKKLNPFSYNEFFRNTTCPPMKC